ncbi:MAG: hypothetical protein R3C05_13780 [Pirellulaceae bacterium]
MAGPVMRRTRMLNIQFVHGDADECGKLLTAIVATYQAFIHDQFQDTSTEAIDLIDQARQELGEDLAKQEEEYRTFRERASLIWNGKDVVNAHQVRLIEIEKSISENRLKHTSSLALETLELAMQQSRGAELSELEQMALIDESDISRLGLLVSVKRGEPLFGIVPVASASA